jgi:hypothetical protein
MKKKGIKQGLPSSMYFTLREEHGLRVFNNTVLRRIFEPKKDKVRGDYIKRSCKLGTPDQILFW